MIQPAFHNHRRSFFVGFSMLSAPPKPMTNHAINTDPIAECSLCSPVAPVLPDAMDISTSTSPPINHTIGCNRDSFKMKEFAALLREADEIEKLEAQVIEREDELSRLRKSLNLLRNRYEQLLKDKNALPLDVDQSTTRSKEIKEDKQVTRANERALECLYAIIHSFAETNSERLTASDCYRLLGVPETATPQEIRKQQLRLQSITHPDPNPTCHKKIETMLTGIYDILSTPKNSRILHCCGLRALRNQKSHLCSFCCRFYDLDTSTYWV